MVTKTYSDLHVRLDKDIRTQAEAILDDFGISPSGAINIFYHQIIAHEGLPFKMARRDGGMLDFDSLTQKELDAHLKVAENEIKCGKYQPVDDVFREILGDRHAKV